MAECLAEIETALGRIVEKVGEERFRACLAPVEEEIAKSGRDVRVVPLYDVLGGLKISGVLPQSLRGFQRRAMVVLLRVIQVAVVWRRSRRCPGPGGGPGGGESKAKRVKMWMKRALT